MINIQASLSEKSHVSFYDVLKEDYQRDVSYLAAELLHISRQKRKEIKMKFKNEEVIASYFHLYYFRDIMCNEVFVVVAKTSKDAAYILSNSNITRGSIIKITAPYSNHHSINNVRIFETNEIFEHTNIYIPSQIYKPVLNFSSEFIGFRLMNFELKYISSRVFESCNGMCICG